LPRLLVEVAIEPKSKSDREKLDIALAKLAADDPTLRVSIDPDKGRRVLQGTSESHLGSKIDSLRRADAVDAYIGAQHVVYHETLTKPVEIDHVNKGQTGRSGQFARVAMIFAPSEEGEGPSFESKVVGGAIPEHYIPGVERGITSDPGIDVVATLVDGAYHDIESSVLAFESAARAALRTALQRCGAVLEPVMKVEVTTSEDSIESVTRDLLSRRGQVHGQSMRGDVGVIDATAPLADLLGYARQLRSSRSGRADCALEFSHYAPILSLDFDPPFSPAVGLRA